MALNEVQIENALPGSPNWELSNPATNREIEGYASLTSVNQGDPINLYVSTNDPQFTIDIYRTGWYGGAGARLVTSIPNLPGQLQPMPTPAADTMLVECQWAISHTFSIPNNWTSGVYLARLTGAASAKQSYIIFVVRDDPREADLFYQLSIDTYQAYNFWPGGSNGMSLYSWAPGGAAPKVSFNRPYVLGFSYANYPLVAAGLGAGEYLTNVQPDYFDGFSPAGFEYNMVRWLEKNGFDVVYGTNVDVHEHGNALQNYRGFLSVGHDEYWSMQMRKSVQAALDNGVSLGFFSSNTAYWQVRFEPAADGAPNRTMVCYKLAADNITPNPNDPQHGTMLATCQFRQSPIGMPEARMIGSEYICDGLSGDITISNASHWLLEGTGLTNGERLRGMLGYEVDAYIPGTSDPAVETLASSPISAYANSNFPPGYPSSGPPQSNVTWYTNGQTSVFATGSMQWNWGLDDYNSPSMRPAFLNPAAAKITATVLNTFVSPITICIPANLPAFTAQQLGTYTFSAIGGVAPLSWSASGLPVYLTMSSNGQLSGSPAALPAQVPIAFSVTVTDANGESATKVFTVPIATRQAASLSTPIAPTEAAGSIPAENWKDASGTLS